MFNVGRNFQINHPVKLTSQASKEYFDEYAPGSGGLSVSKPTHKKHMSEVKPVATSKVPSTCYDPTQRLLMRNNSQSLVYGNEPQVIQLKKLAQSKLSRGFSIDNVSASSSR